MSLGAVSDLGTRGGEVPAVVVVVYEWKLRLQQGSEVPQNPELRLIFYRSVVVARLPPAVQEGVENQCLIGSQVQRDAAVARVPVRLHDAQHMCRRSPRVPANLMSAAARAVSRRVRP